MHDVIEKALELWGVPNANYTLIAARENSVFKISDGTETFALRLHRKGYRTDQELRSELHWMGYVAEHGLKVPAPIPSLEGKFLTLIKDVQVDALTWLTGRPLSELLSTLTTNERASYFHKIGVEMAQLHRACDAWSLPVNFSRCAWDRKGLLGEAPLWDRFWENPFLSPQNQALFLQFRSVANDALSKSETSLDYGLIHADLVAANIMIDGSDVNFIDFDDGGFGFRLFDIATTLLKFIEDADFFALKNALISGYTSVRFLQMTQLDLFLALRAMTYVGWNISRIEEANGTARNQRFIKTASTLARRYLEQDS